MDKSVIINRIIESVKGDSYLEVGYGNGRNFNQIECDNKNAIDPNSTHKECDKITSDDFFKMLPNVCYDVIFIDGLHHADQVRRDIINSMKCNAKAIIMHDTIPPTKDHQIVPRKQLSWTGDCWRAVVGFKQAYPEVKMETYRADYGLTVIYPEGKKVKKNFENMDMSYDDFKSNEIELLNIID